MRDNFKIVKVLAENLRYYRKLRNFTQESLSEKCGLNVLTISNIERMTVWPQPETLETIANALEIDVTELFKDCSKLNFHNNKDLELAYNLITESLKDVVNLRCNDYNVYNAGR